MPKKTKKRKAEVLPTAFCYESAVNKMPAPRDCYFHWVTFQSVRLRTLFESIHNVIHDGVLLIRKASTDENGLARPDRLLLDRYDNSKTMVVYVSLDKLNTATFFVAKDMNIGINVTEFYKTLKAVIQNDVVGICIQKDKWDGEVSGGMTLDLYIMNEADMYCYSFKYKVLAIEYTPVDLPKQTTFRSQISMNCAHFKRCLNDCAAQGDYLKIRSVYNASHQKIETIFTPVHGIMRITQLNLSLFSELPPGFDAAAFGESKKEHEFCTSSLQLFTKATTLCQNVSLLLDDDFPLVVEYDVGTMGKLRFVLAWRMNQDLLDQPIPEPPPKPECSKKDLAALEEELLGYEHDAMQDVEA